MACGRDRVELAVAVKVARDEAEKAGHLPSLLGPEHELARLLVAAPQPGLQLAPWQRRAVAAGWRRVVVVVAGGRRGEEDVDKIVGVVVGKREERAARADEADALGHLLQAVRPMRTARALREVGRQHDIEAAGGGRMWWWRERERRE